MTEEPQIIELDPDRSPRMVAIVLLVCGLLGIGFVVLNSFMGDEPNLVESEWEEGTEPVNPRYDIMPNLIRGKQEVGESDEDEDSTRLKDDLERVSISRKKPTSAPTSPFSPVRPTLPFATPGTPPAQPGAPTPPAGGTAAPPP